MAYLRLSNIVSTVRFVKRESGQQLYRNILRRPLSSIKHIGRSLVVSGPDCYSNDKQQTRGRTAMFDASLVHLPLELLFEIASYLPASSLASLKLSSRGLFCCLKEPPSDWLDNARDCDFRAGHRFLHERKDLEQGQRWCLLCRVYQKSYRFRGDPPICSHHQARFLSSEIPPFLEEPLKRRLESLKKAAAHAYWIGFKRTFCAHKREARLKKWQKETLSMAN